MNRLQQLAGLNEVKIKAPFSKKVVYAICDSSGFFEELILLNGNQIISDEEEDDELDEGIKIVRFNIGEGEDFNYYLEKIEIK